MGAVERTKPSPRELQLKKGLEEKSLSIFETSVGVI